MPIYNTVDNFTNKGTKPKRMRASINVYIYTVVKTKVENVFKKKTVVKKVNL